MKYTPILNACGQEITENDRHITVKEAAPIVGKSNRTIETMVNNGQFPPKHHTSPGRVAFWQSELDEWKKLGCFGWYERYGQAQLAHTQKQQRVA